MSVLCQEHLSRILTAAFRARTMSTNATGLKPEETKALRERLIHSHEQPVITAIQEVDIANLSGFY